MKFGDVREDGHVYIGRCKSGPRANQIKSDATIDELQAVAKFYKRFQKRK